MPTILEQTDVELTRSDLERRTPHIATRPAKRKRGCHVSNVLRYIAVEAGNKAWAKDLEDDELPLRMALGLMWEEFAVTLYPEIRWQPDEMECEGLILNIDGLSTTPINGMDFDCDEEFKFTAKKAKSAEDFMRDEWAWLHTARAYCYGWDTNVTRFHVGHYMGNYRGSGPIYRRYAFQFTEAEIYLTWAMLQKNRQRAIEKGYAEI